MPGTQTAGYDFVIQFSEEAYKDFLGVFFDDYKLLPKISQILGINTNLFSLDLSIDRPTDKPLEPPNAQNPIDIKLGLGVGGEGAFSGETNRRSEGDL